MFIMSLAIMGVCILGSVTFLLILCRAPQGYQDKSGFHLGQQPEDAEDETQLV